MGMYLRGSRHAPPWTRWLQVLETKTNYESGEKAKANSCLFSHFVLALIDHDALDVMDVLYNDSFGPLVRQVREDGCHKEWTDWTDKFRRILPDLNIHVRMHQCTLLPDIIKVEHEMVTVLVNCTCELYL